MKKLFKLLALTVGTVFVLGTLAACNNDEDSGSTDTNGGGNATTGTENGGGTFVGENPWEFDPNTEGRITIFAFHGDDELHENIGNPDLGPEDFFNSRHAELAAAARIFNERYPNIQVDLFAASGEPGQWEVSYQQARENFRNEFGYLPDAWVTQEVVPDVLSGLAADLSIFAGDPLFQSFNPAMMARVNYGGVQAALPSYAFPLAFPVNLSLAEQHNITLPTPNWTLADYLAFISAADMDTFFGDMVANPTLIATAVDTIDAQFAQDGTVNFNTDEVRELVTMLGQIAQYTVWDGFNAGTVSSDVMDQFWWWGGAFFAWNATLANSEAVWNLGDLADPNSGWAMSAENWDVFPFPSATAAQTNRIRLLQDNIVIGNSVDRATAEENALQIAMTYRFVSMFLADNDVFAARAAAQFATVDPYSGEVTLRNAVIDSLPVVSGPSFDVQMAIWNAREGRERFTNADLMPGWHMIMELIEAGDFVQIDTRTDAIQFVEGGVRVNAMADWNNLANLIDDLAITEPGWADQVNARLADLTETTNEYLRRAAQEMEEALSRYYGR